MEAGEAGGARGTIVERRDVVEERGTAAYVAEFVGTLLLVLLIAGAVSLFATSPRHRIQRRSSTGRSSAWFMC